MSTLAINGGQKTREKSFTGWPLWDDGEKNSLINVLESGKWGCLHGDQVTNFEKEFASMHDLSVGVAVASCDAGLRIAYKAIGIKPGDEAIVPAYTFIASAVPAIDCGAKIKFADVLPGTYNIDPASLEEQITEKTKLIIAVHFAGLPARMEEINRIAEKHGIAVIEDAAQAWGSKRYGKYVGNFSPFAPFSFQSSKNITSGEGGIILVRNPEDEDKIRSMANNGRRKEAQWYEHFGQAGNYRLTEFQGAILRNQLKRYPQQLDTREKGAAFLRENLSLIEGITPLERPGDVQASSNHIFIFKYDKSHFGGISKDKFLSALQAEGIPALTGYVLPLYKQPAMADQVTGGMPDMPVSEKACKEEAVWLRHSLLLDSEEDLADIGIAIKKIQDNIKELN
ncbi:MAG: DegT/DnrJ/EryC1/StrS family aminotransferase [Acidobacteria bacterium]|nr:DegT/DnrJ/EryC1/StrS family aminotransferase [Acidobacteriota bacterium]